VVGQAVVARPWIVPLSPKIVHGLAADEASNGGALRSFETGEVRC